MLGVGGGKKEADNSFTYYSISTTRISLLYIFSFGGGEAVLVIYITQGYYQFYPYFQVYLHRILILKIPFVSVFSHFTFYSVYLCFLDKVQLATFHLGLTLCTQNF